MLVIGFNSNRNKYILIFSLFLGIVMNTLQLINELRVFSIVHILMCLFIIIFLKLSYKYFRLLLKVWSVLLLVSGGFVLFSTVLYLLSGAINKISIEGNILSIISFLLGLYLFKYFEKSVYQLK